MSIFLRDLPEKIQLLPLYDDVIIFDDTVCTSLHFSSGVTSYDKSNLNLSADRIVNTAGKKMSFLLGYEVGFVKEHVDMILNKLGFFLVYFLFNKVYKRFPFLAIQSLIISIVELQFYKLLIVSLMHILD